MLGTGDFALPTFLHLLETGHDVVTLITQPDRPQGRKQELSPSRIKEAALGKGVPVYQPENVNAPEASTWIKGLNPDFLVTAAYGQILSAEVLSIPRIAAINLHGSILPAYRGAAPVARAIERGETTHGVTVIVMNPRVDAGGMLKFAKTAIENPAAAKIEGHQSAETQEGRRDHRLESPQSRDPQPRPRHATLAHGVNALDSARPALRPAGANDRPPFQGGRPRPLRTSRNGPHRRWRRTGRRNGGGKTGDRDLATRRQEDARGFRVPSRQSDSRWRSIRDGRLITGWLRSAIRP